MILHIPCIFHTFYAYSLSSSARSARSRRFDKSAWLSTPCDSCYDRLAPSLDFYSPIRLLLSVITPFLTSPPLPDIAGEILDSFVDVGPLTILPDSHTAIVFVFEEVSRIRPAPCMLVLSYISSPHRARSFRGVFHSICLHCVWVNLHSNCGTFSKHFQQFVRFNAVWGNSTVTHFSATSMQNLGSCQRTSNEHYEVRHRAYRPR